MNIALEYSYIEYMRDFINFYGNARCLAIIIYPFQDVYKKPSHTGRIYLKSKYKKTQPLL